ncbi:protein gar2-like, partial [Trifolium medium]|nr:protein gar2-like [Trifolium medium]
GQRIAHAALYEKATAAQNEVERFRASQRPGLGVQECNANITKWEEEIAAFQAQISDRERKISGEKEKRTKIEEAVASTTQEAIDEAAKDGIKYY